MKASGWTIERLYREYGDLVLRRARRIMGSEADAQEILQELFVRLGQRPGTVDLARLFAELGVRSQGASVVFDEHAPLAKLRQSITARRPG